MSQILAILYCLIILTVIGFQVFLIMGKPWGEITQGGKWPGVLPIQGKIIAFVSIFILLFMGMAILSAADVLFDFPVCAYLVSKIPSTDDQDYASWFFIKLNFPIHVSSVKV